MFSTTTIASSTRMPIEKINANSDTRLSVKPQAQEANSVTVSVRITAAADDRGLAPAERDEDEGDDGRRREEQFLDQLDGLVVGRGAVVARLGDFHVGRDRPCCFSESATRWATASATSDRVGSGLLADG